MSQCNSFQPIAGTSPKAMILGTMPSVKSLENQFYYSHSRNAFWPILSQCLHRPAQSEADKRRLIAQSPFILWDVLQSCEREGSLDSAIKNPVANDFSRIFKEYPDVSTLLFNGQPAYQLFKRWVIPHQTLPDNLVLEVMPSTSPANARMPFEEKLARWQAKLSKFL